jgi:flagellar motor switch protein FliN/FliY
MDDPNQLQAARTFASAFAESLAESLTLKLGTPWLLKTLEDADLAGPAKPAVHFRLSAAGGLQGECFVAFEQAQVIAFGSKLLEQSSSALSDPQGEALAEVIVSAMEGVSSSLSAQFGAVTFKVDRVEDVRLEEMLTVPLDVSSEKEADTPILLHFNEQLLASLSSSNEGKTSAKAKKATIDPANLQLVMDVELNVSLRFGQCQLPLRDVLDLTSGSVIELDRDVDDPVELLLDGKVIARGEAVIIDGNYGLRVTEIPEPIASHFVS